MIITPIYLALFLAEGIPHHFLWGLLVYAVGCVTDLLDGKIARKYGLVTVFGKLADPVADKMLTTAALLALMQLGFCNIWIVMAVLVREFTVTSLRLVASAQGVVIPANIWGKCKTVSQMVFTILIMLGCELQYSGVLAADFPFALVSNILLAITAMLALVSGAIYVAQAVKVIDFKA